VPPRSLRRHRQPLPRPPLPQRPQAKTRLLLLEAGGCVTSEDSSQCDPRITLGSAHGASAPLSLRTSAVILAAPVTAAVVISVALAFALVLATAVAALFVRGIAIAVACTVPYNLASQAHRDARDTQATTYTEELAGHRNHAAAGLHSRKVHRKEAARRTVAARRTEEARRKPEDHGSPRMPPLSRA
jgi:hypothetical protein